MTTTMHIIPHAHCDYAWTHHRQWHIERYILILEEVLEIMDRDPDFTWMTDNIVHTLTPFFEHRPGLLEKFRQRVEEGRLEITNGALSLLRPTQAGGEAFIRNIVYGRRFLRTIIPGHDTRVYHSVDVNIGHSQLPQVLRLAGYDHYRAWRPQGALDAKGFPREFVWRGADGSEIVCTRGIYAGLGDTAYLERDFDKDWDSIKAAFIDAEIKDTAARIGSTEIWVSHGMDDARPLRDFYDKPARIAEFVSEWNKREDSRIRFSTAREYFESLAGQELAVVSGVLDGSDAGYNVPTKGESGLWRKRQELERLLIKTEVLSSMAAMVAGASYPRQRLEEVWGFLLYLYGHAMEFVLESDYDTLLKQAAAALHEAEDIKAEATAKIASAQHGGKQYVLFNTLNWEREEIVPLRLCFPKGGKKPVLKDSNGNELEYQVSRVIKGDICYVGSDFDELDVLVKAKVPALGCVGIFADEPASDKQTMSLDGFGDELDFKLRGAATHKIDTGKICAEFRDGRIVSVTDASGEPIVSPAPCAGGLGGLKFTHFKQHSHTAWLFTNHYTGADMFEPEKWEWKEYGPLRWVYEVKGRLGAFIAVQRMIMHKDSDTIEFSVDLISSQPVPGFLAASFPLPEGSKMTAGIPFGSEPRDISSEPYGMLTENTLDNLERIWDGVFYANEWLSYGDAKFNHTLIGTKTGSYYLRDAAESTISIILTKMYDLSLCEDWVKYIHHSAECVGRNNFCYAISFDKPGSEDVLTSIRKAKEKIYPIETAVKIGEQPAATAGASGTMPDMLGIESGSAVLSALYMEDGKFILRMYEAEGKNTRVMIKPAFKLKSARAVDFNGLNTTGDDGLTGIDNGFVSADLKPGQIITIELEV